MSKRIPSSSSSSSPTNNKKQRTHSHTDTDILSPGDLFAMIPNEIFDKIVYHVAHPTSILKNITMARNLSLVNTRFYASVSKSDHFALSYTISYACCSQADVEECTPNHPHFNLCYKCDKQYEYAGQPIFSKYPGFTACSDSPILQILVFKLYNGHKKRIFKISQKMNFILCTEEGKTPNEEEELKMLEDQKGVFYEYTCFKMCLDSRVRMADGGYAVELKKGELLGNVSNQYNRKTPMKRCFSYYEGLKHIFLCNIMYLENKL
jgi:hypothetical protein